MLQMPSSILSLGSFSKGLVGLFGGVCIGTQVALNIVVSGLSNPKTSVLIATRTTGNVPSPTKSVPSNGSFPFPFAYVAALAFATFVFAALFCILRAKRVCSPVSSQPDPLPPSDMGSSCGAENNPPPTRWWWIVGLIVAILGLAFVGFYVYFAYDDVYFAYDNLHSNVGSTVHAVASFFGQNMQLWEVLSNTFHPIIPCISAFMIDLFLHGRRYSKILLLAGMGYSSCVLAIGLLCRLRAFVAARVPSASNPRWTLFCIWVGTAIIISSSPYLSWIHWMPYYTPWILSHRLRYDPRLAWFWMWVRQSSNSWVLLLGPVGSLHTFLSAAVGWHALTWAEKSMIVGPVIAQVTVVILSFAFLAMVYCVLTFIKAIRALYKRPGPMAEVLWHLRSIRRFYLPVLLLSSYFSCLFLHATFPDTVWEQHWSFVPRGMYRFWASGYRKWKFDQIAGFSKIFSGLRASFSASFKVCVETWHALT
ncbi:hypothetical protein C8R43DRAFT_1231072, partial [Mycena crocata]